MEDNIMLKERQNVPLLRFPEFSGEWVEKKLGDIAEKSKLKNIDSNIKTVFSNSATMGIVLQENYFDNTIVNENNINGYYIVNPNTFVYNPRLSSNALVGAMNVNKLGVIGIVSPLYTVFNTDYSVDVDFLRLYFKSKTWHAYMKSIANYGARDDRMNIKDKDFFLMPINMPSISEQTKIADFLSVIDERIDLLTQKKKMLETYKKGLMQKLFSQELRFKDENGNDYPDWEECKINEVFSFSQGIQVDVENQFNEKHAGMERFIRIVDVTQLNEPFRYVVKSSDKGMVLETDIFMVRYGAVGMVGIGYKGIIANNLFKLIPTRIINSQFMAHQFQQDIFYNKILSLSASTSMPAINFSSMSSIVIFVPSLAEQGKIANFLSSIDDKITALNDKINNSQQYKKGLLQQMFV